MKRSEIWIADLGDPIGHEQGFQRPVILLNAQQWLTANPPVIAALPLTRTPRDWPTHVEIEPGTSGLKAISYAKCEDLRAISPQRLRRHLGKAEPPVMVAIETTVRRLLQL